MEQLYDPKNQILTIKWNDLTNREARIPINPRTYNRLERIEKTSKSRIEKLNY